jgi:hypothetical protein
LTIKSIQKPLNTKKKMKNFKLIFTALLAVIFVLGGSVALAAIPPATLLTTAAVSPVFSGLETYIKNKNELFTTLINGLDIAQDVTVETMVKSKLQFTKLSVSDGARPYSATEEIEGDELTYSGITLEVLQGKRELSIEIKRYYAQWLQETMRGSGAAKGAMDIPFAQYTWSKVIEKLQEEINNKTSYFGFTKGDAVAYATGDTYSVGDYVTFTVGTIAHYYKAVAAVSTGETPTAAAAKWQKVNAEAIAPGLGEHLAALITAGDVTVTTTGVIDNASNYAVASLRAIWGDVNESYKNKGVKAYMARNVYELYLEDYGDKVGKFTEGDSSGKRFLYLSDGKCELCPVSWMSGSNRVIMTPKENVILGTDLLSDMNEIEIVKSTLWTIKAGISFVLGFKFRDAEAIWCNDAA